MAKIFSLEEEKQWKDDHVCPTCKTTGYCESILGVSFYSNLIEKASSYTLNFRCLNGHNWNFNREQSPLMDDKYNHYSDQETKT